MHGGEGGNDRGRKLILQQETMKMAGGLGGAGSEL